ncbi:MAG: TonB-dependent receptor [Bryobacteraceae bacterium]
MVLRRIALVSFFSISAFAQTSQITGRVADPTGAVVPLADIAVTNVDTGTRYPTQSNVEGYYTVSRLDPGPYQVIVQKTGFKQARRSGIVLQVDQTARLDFTLQVGEVAEQIEITAETPLIESESSNLGQVINNKSIVEMPLNGRNAWDLSKLVGGAVYVQGFGDAGEVPAVSFSGGRTWSQAMMLDGGSVQKSAMSRAQAELSPMVDAVEEFKVISNNYAAEYGRSAAGVFTAVTKSGTNRFRGNLFEFFRNDAMDARNFFAVNKAPLRYNQFGGTLGGPIRKDKTHFFVALEATKTTRGQTLILTMPSAARRSGNFTGLRNAAGRDLPLYNPFTTRNHPTDPTRKVRDPFPNNIVPSSLFDPVAVRALSFYPDPNQPGNAVEANNFNVNVPVKRTQYHGTLRVDHVLSDKDRIFGRYVAQHNATPQASAFPEPAASGVGGLASRNVANLAHTYLGSWVRTFSPSLLSDLKVSGTNQDRDILHASVDAGWPEKLGLRGVGDRSFPVFSPQGYTALGSANVFRAQTNPYWQALETISYYRGSHSVKAGFEYRHNRTTDEFDRQPSGQFTFAQQGTGLQGNTLSGDGLATMLLGFATNAVLNDSPLLAFNNYSIGMFVQDDWKVTTRLTLNLGVRYDVETGRIADKNTQNGFAIDQIHPLAGRPGVVTFAGVDEPARLFNTDKNNVSPRFGFAWRPFNKESTVIRGGAGLFFGNPDDQGYSNTAVLGFATEAQRVSPDQNQTAALLLKDGFPNAQPPGPADRTPAFGLNSPVNFYQRERASPYSIQYNFGIQQEVKSLLLSGQYVANLGRKLTGGGLSMNQVRPELVGQPGSIQSRRPFPQFTNVTLNSPNLGHSSYHAFLWRAEKRYQQGLQFLFNYTFSKFIDNVDALSDFGGTPGAGYQDYYNRRLDKAISPLDITHNATFNVIYDLPLGPGRNWLHAGPASQILGGWQLSFLTTLLSGPVYGVTTQQNTTEASSAGAQRANILRDPTLPAGQRTPEKWFDTGAFAQPARFLFGNAARSVGRAPGTRNFDIGVMKNFSVRERFRIQFRAEMFNAFNNVNFGIPGTAFGSPQFGVINTAQSARVTQLGLKIYF